MYADEDLILISGLQHVAFCERQWVLIHMEQEWRENILTIEGKHMHEFVHEQGSESRCNIRTVRGLRLRSLKLGLYGVADMVEFHREDAVVVKNIGYASGRWIPYPVEYKRGRKRYDLVDEVQLCAQALCLEEMLEVPVLKGAIYYGQPRRRNVIEFSSQIRDEVSRLSMRARKLYEGKCIPQFTAGPHCKNCSLYEICMPETTLKDNSVKYVEKILKEISEYKGVIP